MRDKLLPLVEQLALRIAFGALRSAPLVVLSLLSTGCLAFQHPAESLVRVHATKDLDCPDADVRVTEEWGGKYKAVGCGRKAYYRTACDGLQCVVHGEGDEFVPWRDRPDPSDRLSR